MNRLFEPFFTTKETGSGLGLALSQRIAGEYGGRITVERGKPKGTVFILRLPLGEGGKA
jgi:signal transduction histidine kinase